MSFNSSNKSNIDFWRKKNIRSVVMCQFNRIKYKIKMWKEKKTTTTQKEEEKKNVLSAKTSAIGIRFIFYSLLILTHNLSHSFRSLSLCSTFIATNEYIFFEIEMYKQIDEKKKKKK